MSTPEERKQKVEDIKTEVDNKDIAQLNAELGFGGTTSPVSKPYSINYSDGLVTITIDASNIASIQPNANGNRVLNVYHKFNPALKFSGNLMLLTK